MRSFLYIQNLIRRNKFMLEKLKSNWKRTVSGLLAMVWPEIYAEG